MKIKDYIEQAGIHKIMKQGVMVKLLELEALENYMITMLGVEFEITVKPVEVREGRFYGKGLAESIRND